MLNLCEDLRCPCLEQCSATQQNNVFVGICFSCNMPPNLPSTICAFFGWRMISNAAASTGSRFEHDLVSLTHRPSRNKMRTALCCISVQCASIFGELRCLSIVSKPLAGDSSDDDADNDGTGPLEKDISERLASGAPCQHLIDSI